MTFDPSALHPAVAAKGGLSSPSLGPSEQTYAETLTALVDSQRSREELVEAASVLNPLLDDQLALEAVAAKILKAAQGARDARSGMGCDLALDDLRLGLDDARAQLGQRS